MSDESHITEFSRIGPFKIGDVEIVPRQLLLKSVRGEVSVEPKVMALLVTLAERERDTWTRAELIDRIWGIEFGGDESLTRAVHGLRKALAEPHELRSAVKTLPKVGYRLDADVNRLPDSTPTSSKHKAPISGKSFESETVPENTEQRDLAAINAKQNLLPLLSRRNLIVVGGASVAIAGAMGIQALIGKTGQIPEFSNNLVVLPFTNETGDEALDFLASGVSGEIRHSLSRNQALNILARRSSEAIRRRSLGVMEIAEEFGSSFILDGRLSQFDGKVRLSTELIEARSGNSRWSEAYDASNDRLLAIQSAVTGEVSREASRDFTNEAVLALGLPTNPEAFEIYLKAKDQLAKITGPDDAINALSVLDTAIMLDPNFALAHTTRARWLSWVSGANDNAEVSAQYLREALQAAERALELEPELAETHSTLGWVRFFSALDVSGAAEPYERSIELAPNDAVTLARYAPYIALVGDEVKARRTIQNAVLLDPLNPSVHRIAAMVHYYANRPEQALKSIDEVIKLQPNAVVAQYWKGRAQIALNSPLQGVETCEQETNLDAKLSCQGIGYAHASDQARAISSIEKLTTEYGDKAAYQRAQILAVLGQEEEAMQALNLAWQKRDPGLVSLKVDTVFSRMSAREDFLHLLQSIGFDT